MEEKELNLIELCEMVSIEEDKEIKERINQLIAKKLCSNDHDKKQMIEALNEPLRHNKGIKKKVKTRYNYNIK